MPETAPGRPSPSQEADWLRANWDPAVLGRYEGEWIAVLGSEVIGADAELDTLLDRTARYVPLYAYVTFEPRQ